jgi:2-hydroxy-3-keto-5-methylthiopentenyl-1-phosphate phosphatase
MPRIAIVWDFDGTLTPQESTGAVVEILGASGGSKKFWADVKRLRGDNEKPTWEHILAMDAPIWMYSLSRLAFERQIPLNKEFFKRYVAPRITLYPRVAAFLRKLKLVEERRDLKAANVEIHYFIITAGLKHLVELLFPEDLIRWTFGCVYAINEYLGDPKRPESIPTFCMDETAKTRSLFEISKGSFENKKRSVNSRVKDEDLWVPFRDMIYVGDGMTDVPALSLVRRLGGLGVVVFDPRRPDAAKEKLKALRLDKRADLITAADFDPDGELFDFMEARCVQIGRRHRAELADI